MEEKRAWKVGEAGRVFLRLSRKPMPVPSQRAMPRVRPGSSRPGALVPGRLSTLRGHSPQCRLLPRKVPQAFGLNSVSKGVKNAQVTAPAGNIGCHPTSKGKVQDDRTSSLLPSQSTAERGRSERKSRFCPWPNDLGPVEQPPRISVSVETITAMRIIRVIFIECCYLPGPD